jgi:MFS family permease
MLDQLQTWWQNTNPEMKAAFMDGGLALVALLGGHFLGAMVARGLRARNFDAFLRLPSWSPPAAAPETERGFTPTLFAGILVRLTAWAGAASWLANKHGMVDLGHTLWVIIGRTWAVAAMLVAALALGSLLASRLLECLQGTPGAGSEPVAPSRLAAGAPQQRGAAGAVAAMVYVLAFLLVLLMAADLFDWPLTRTSALALWQFAQHLLIAGAALLIGYLGARWARDLATPDGAASPEKRAGQYTALTIMAGTSVLAVVMLLSSAGVLFGIAALALLGLLMWMGRGYLPDIAAGLQLRVYKIGEVWLDGEPWQVSEVGFRTTELNRRGELRRLPNGAVLEARLHGAPAGAPVANGAGRVPSAVVAGDRR